MTERELLELAAKAAGFNLVWDFDEYMEGPCTVDEDGFPNFWNPIDDDGDALRLAVKLELHITNANGHAWASTEFHDATEPYGSDRSAATRRAIVRAAAEIGKAMP